MGGDPGQLGIETETHRPFCLRPLAFPQHPTITNACHTPAVQPALHPYTTGAEIQSTPECTDVGMERGQEEATQHNWEDFLFLLLVLFPYMVGVR